MAKQAPGCAGVTALLWLGAACGGGSNTLANDRAASAGDVVSVTLPGEAATADVAGKDAKTGPSDGGGLDVTTTTGDATVPDAFSNDGDPFFDGNLGDVIVIGPPQVDSSIPDSGPDAPVLDACGICDRVWVCNGITDTWRSSGPEACADIRGTTTVATLYCEHGNTINFPDPMNNDGTWSKTSTGLALDYYGLEGVMEIDCVPGS